MVSKWSIIFSSKTGSKTCPKFSSSLATAASRTFGSAIASCERLDEVLVGEVRAVLAALNFSISSDSSDFSGSLAPPEPSPKPFMLGGAFGDEADVVLAGLLHPQVAEVDLADVHAAVRRAWAAG